MASTSLSTLSNALSQEFEPMVARQMNRKTVTLQLLPKVIGGGKNLAWDPQFDGSTAAEYAEGADVAEADYDNDEEAPATLSWGLYRAAGRVTGLAAAAAATSQSPQELQDLFKERVMGNASKLGAKVNADLFAGTGANRILGIDQGAFAATGTYATIDRAVRTEWAGNVLANGGIGRAISFALMDELLEAIYTRSGTQPDVFVMHPTQFRKFGALFESNRRWPISEITTAAGTIKLAGGFQALEHAGIPVVRDKDATLGKVFAVNTSETRVKFLPTRPGQDNAGPNNTFQVADDKGNFSGLPARISMLAKTGDTTKWMVYVYAQLQCRTPNANGILADIL